MRKYVREQTETLLRRFAFQVSSASKALDPDAVHDLRTSIRRFSGCLRIFADFYPDRSAKQVRRKLRELMAGAGAVRDLDIAIKLAGDAGLGRYTTLELHLVEERRKAAHELRIELLRWGDSKFYRKWRTRLGLHS